MSTAPASYIILSEHHRDNLPSVFTQGEAGESGEPGEDVSNRHCLRHCLQIFVYCSSKVMVSGKRKGLIRQIKRREAVNELTLLRNS